MFYLAFEIRKREMVWADYVRQDYRPQIGMTVRPARLANKHSLVDGKRHPTIDKLQIPIRAQ